MLVVANHPGVIDAGLVLGACPRPARILDSDDVFVPALDRIFDLTGRIKMVTTGPDFGAIATARSALADGEVVAMFPELHRGDGRVARIRHEVAYLALRSDAVLMPVALLGTLNPGMAPDALPKRRTPMVVAFGVPYRVAPVADPLNRRAIAGTAEGIRQRLADHVASASIEHQLQLPGQVPRTLTNGNQRRGQERLS